MKLGGWMEEVDWAAVLNYIHGDWLLPFVEGGDYALNALMGDEAVITTAFAIFALICLRKYRNFYPTIWTPSFPPGIPFVAPYWDSLFYSEYFGTLARTQETIYLASIAATVSPTDYLNAV